MDPYIRYIIFIKIKLKDSYAKASYNFGNLINLNFLKILREEEKHVSVRLNHDIMLPSLA